MSTFNKHFKSILIEIFSVSHGKCNLSKKSKNRNICEYRLIDNFHAIPQLTYPIAFPTLNYIIHLVTVCCKTVLLFSKSQMTIEIRYYN